MITFFICLAILILGYIFYGKYLEKSFGIDASRETPASRLYDGMDYIPLGWFRAFIIQFLNIAGLGPIFGAIAGAMFGPVVFIWIVLGTIFGGAMHDFLGSMISLRQDGLSMPEVVGEYLGEKFKIFLRLFSIVLLIQVGAIFVKGPAVILALISPDYLNVTFWVYVIFIYYFFATLLPIDKLIGRIYPFFGAALLFMAISVTFGIIFGGYAIPELTFDHFTNMNMNADSNPIFPMMFVSVACGAISGFHSTQSPLMSRCIKSEAMGKRVFYGAMVAEGIVALIWAAAAMSFYGGVENLNHIVLIDNIPYPNIIHTISETMLGKFGAVLAILGVVAAPITTGDTAFRSARLVIADFRKTEQKSLKKRLLITVPLFLVGYVLTQIQFDIIWRYFAWSNQTLAAIVLWSITSYMYVNKKNYWISLLPAIFMTAVCSVYILIAPEGFEIDDNLAYTISGIITIAITYSFFRSLHNRINNHEIHPVA